MPSKSVILLSPSAAQGGAERALVALAKHLPLHGYRPIVVVLGQGPLKEWLADVPCQYIFLDGHRVRNFTSSFRTIRKLRRLLRTSGADAIVSSMSKGHLYGGTAALGIPFTYSIWWEHGMPRDKPILMERAARAVKADAIVHVSDAALHRHRGHSAKNRVRIYPGVERSEVSADPKTGDRIKEQLGWRNLTVVGMIGRLQEHKGHREFLDAARQLSEHRSDVRFLVLGGAILGSEGAYPGNVIALAESYSLLPDLLYFAGHQADVLPWISAMDIVLNPATNEGFGLSLVEAMALGKPIVAVNDSGPGEILEQGVSGLLVSPGDVPALVSHTLALIADTRLASSLGAGASLRSQEFTAEHMAGEFAKLFNARSVRGLRERHPSS